MYRRNLRVFVVTYWTTVWSPLVIHKNGSHSHAKHCTAFVSSELQPPEMQIFGISKFWCTRCMDCLLMYLHTKKTNQVRSRYIGVHCWPACLSLYLCGKLLLRNSATLVKTGTLDHFVWKRKWYCHLFHSVASSILPSHYSVSACNCPLCDKERLCY